MEASRINLVMGDIVRQEVDAIVNAANPTLLGGGGVDGAIHRAAGPALLEACRALRWSAYPDGLPPGEAAATEAGDLPARWVIHTVGPIYSGAPEDATTLRRAYLSSLRVADDVGARSVAFPAISSGAYGYPLKEAAEVAIGTVSEAATNVDEVRFVLFGRRAYDAFARALTPLRG
jgi:O-acetyl-ADP-ribose deacetylase